MKRVVYLGMGDGGLWLAIAGEPIPKGATVLDAKDGRFWLRKSVPPMAHRNVLDAVSDIAEALGYSFHGAAPFADLPWVLDTIESALFEDRVVAFRLANNEGGGQAPQPQQKQQAKEAPKAVNAVIDEPDLLDAKLGTVVLVVKKAKNPDGGKLEQYTHPARKSLVLKTDAAFGGKGTLTWDPADKVKLFTAKKGGDEIKVGGKTNVFQGKALQSGITVWVEGHAPAKDIKAKLTLSGGPQPIGSDDTAIITSVEVTLDIHAPKPGAGAASPAMSQDDKVFVGRNLLVQNGNNSFDRGELTIQDVKPSGLASPLTLVLKPAADGHMDAFKDENAKNPAGQTSSFTGGRFEIKSTALPKTLWAQAKSPSDKMKDTGFTLGVVGVDEDQGDKVTTSAIQIKLDICQTRKKAAAKGEWPDAMSEADKIGVGRFVHEQDASFHHGRALVIIREVKPKSFKGTLTLKSMPSLKTDLFGEKFEHHEAAEKAETLPLDIDYSKVKNEDKRFWVEGKPGGASARMLDAGYWVELKGDRPGNADTVLMTVVKFTHLKADISVTPAQTLRTIGGVANANRPARHTLEITGGAVDHWEFDDAKNQALVLIEDSIRGADPINLTVKIAPADAAKYISWDAPRDIRPAPDGDHKDIAKLSGSPSIFRNAADHTKATLISNAVGTFHVAPFIDCNGTNHFEPTIDREPYLTMNLVLVRVEGVSNDSQAGTAARCSDFASGNAAATARTILTAASPNPSGSTGAYVVTGDATIANAAAYSKATAKLTGGGDKGLRGIEKTAGGLDRVFAGWCQHIEASPTSASAPQNLDIFGGYVLMKPNPVVAVPPLAPMPEWHQSFFVFTQSAAAPWVPEPCPVLDVSPGAADGTGGDSCTGQWGRHGPLNPLTKGGATPTIKDKALGQEWTVETLDSPSVGMGRTHPGHAGSFMVQFRFNISFRVDLVFWTNITGVATPSADPANRLYSTVQTNRWTVAYSVAFDWNAVGHPIVGAPPAVTITMNKDPSPTRRATRVDSSGLETRFPTALGTLKKDSTA